MRVYLRQAAAFQNYDRLLAYSSIILGALLTVAVFILRLYSQIGVPLTIIAVALTHLVLGQRLSRPVPTTSRVGVGRHTSTLTIFVPASLLTGFVLVAWLAIGASADALQRPTWVLLFLTVLPVIILAQTLFLPGKQFIPLELALVAATIVLTTIGIYPYDGGDTWTHIHNAELILKDHTVRAISDAYRDYPLYPAVLAGLSALTHLNPADVARLVSMFVAVICLLLLYAVARQFFSSFQSVILALLLLGSKWFLYWTTAVVAMPLAVVFYCLVIAILLRRLHHGPNLKEVGLLILLSTLIPFFHPIVAVTAIVAFAGFWVLERFGTASSSLRRSSLMGMVILVVVVTLAQWMYFGEFIFDRTARDMAHAIFREGQVALGVARAYRDPLVTLLDEVNFYALLGLAGLDILRQLRLKTGRLNLVTAAVGLGFIGFGYLVQMVALKAAVPDRWFLFGSLLLVFPASSTFVSLFRRDSRWGRVGALLFIGAYMLMGLINNQVNRDQPVYGERLSYTSALTSSQMAGLVTLKSVLAQREVTVRTDSWLWNYLQYAPGSTHVWYWDQVQLDNFNGIFARRPEYAKNRFFGYSSMLNFNTELAQEQAKVSQFYDSGDLQLLERVDKDAPTPPQPTAP